MCTVESRTIVGGVILQLLLFWLNHLHTIQYYIHPSLLCKIKMILINAFVSDLTIGIAIVLCLVIQLLHIVMIIIESLITLSAPNAP